MELIVITAALSEELAWILSNLHFNVICFFHRKYGKYVIFNGIAQICHLIQHYG